MSVQLALLQSGEEVISDIKEFRNSEDELISYLFKNPFVVKIKTSQVLVEENSKPKHEVIYYKWMSLSKESDIIVNKDWIVCITDPLDSIKKSYEDKINGRRSNDSNRSSDGRDGATTRRSESGGEIESDSGTVLNEQSEVDLAD
tara:strand:- start:72 stop:506 length:435 start_codon:yes stop_codon:yes gene_type:complete